MKSTGEVMAIADTFEAALLKAVRGAEIGLDRLALPRLQARTDEEIRPCSKQLPTSGCLCCMKPCGAA